MPMPRPMKWRRVEFLPPVSSFQPMGGPPAPEGDVVLSMEELEAIRLKDREGLDQETCAENMQVSRPTFHRIIRSARHKVAMALTQGRGLRIAGGRYCMTGMGFRCRACRHGFKVGKVVGPRGGPAWCPRCSSSDVEQAESGEASE